jgi:polysaccharide export outer membrane protein
MKTIHQALVLFLLLTGSLLWTAAHASIPDYKIGPDDVLRITVYDHPDMATVARVDNMGNILLPLAGQVAVGGLTTLEASAAIVKKLDGAYIINPQVAVFVEEFRSKKVVIIGEVVRPGLYELSGSTSLLELISKAGGLKEGAGQSVTIRRSAEDNVAQEGDFTVNLKDLLENGMQTVDVPIMDGDTVNVLKAGVVYVTGQVNRPAAYKLEPDTTVIKAITMAGGFTALAAQNKVKIIRKVDGKEQVLERTPMHEKLRADDVMVVPESFF